MTPKMIEPILETLSLTGLMGVFVFWLGVAQSGAPF